MTQEQKQAWRDYLHRLRQYQLDVITYYADCVQYMHADAARDGEDDGTGSNPPTPPTPPKPPGS